jgi:hypothetical protein
MIEIIAKDGMDSFICDENQRYLGQEYGFAGEEKFGYMEHGGKLYCMNEYTDVVFKCDTTDELYKMATAHDPVGYLTLQHRKIILGSL